MRFTFDQARQRAFLAGWLLATAAFILMSPAIYRAMTTQPAARSPVFDDDDAAAITAAFGPPDADFVTNQSPGDPSRGTRFMVYRSRDVRIALVRRDVGDPPHLAWRVVGPADGTGRIRLSGDEALRRLRRRR